MITSQQKVGARMSNTSSDVSEPVLSFDDFVVNCKKSVSHFF